MKEPLVNTPFASTKKTPPSLIDDTYCGCNVDHVTYKHVCTLRPPRVDPIVAARGAVCASSPRDALVNSFLAMSTQGVIQMRYDRSRFADLQLELPSLDMSRCKNSAEK